MEAARASYGFELVEQARKVLPRDEYGHIDERQLEDFVLDNMEFDAEQERRNKARRIIRGCCATGHEAIGQLLFPGMEQFFYFGNSRLVLNGEGQLIEEAKARALDMSAEARRSATNRRRVDAKDNFKQESFRAFSEWTIREQQAGRPPKELTYDAFVHEAEILKPLPPTEQHPPKKPSVSECPEDEDEAEQQA